MMTRAQAWAWYLDRAPDGIIVADGKVMNHLAYVPKDNDGRCNSDACWCHVVPLLTGEGGNDDAR
jgi:ArsR family metal-binding transcriptional regulator